jgi:hypothetical protein
VYSAFAREQSRHEGFLLRSIPWSQWILGMRSRSFQFACVRKNVRYGLRTLILSNCKMSGRAVRGSLLQAAFPLAVAIMVYRRFVNARSFSLSRLSLPKFECFAGCMLWPSKGILWPTRVVNVQNTRLRSRQGWRRRQRRAAGEGGDGGGDTEDGVGEKTTKKRLDGQLGCLE